MIAICIVIPIVALAVCFMIACLGKQQMRRNAAKPSNSGVRIISIDSQLMNQTINRNNDISTNPQSNQNNEISPYYTQYIDQSINQSIATSDLPSYDQLYKN